MPVTAKLLFVAHVLPFPENTGTKIRLANLLRAACAAGPVKFIGFIDQGPAHDPENEEGVRQLLALCPDAELIPRRHAWWPDVERDSLKWTLKHYVLASGAFVFREFACDALVDAVRRHAADAEVIWVERLWIAHHLRDLGHKIIVDLDDIESVKIGRRMKGWKLTAPVLAAWYDWWKTRRAERKALEVFQRAAVCSEEDTQFWPGQRDRVWVVPNGFNDELLDLPLPEIDVPRVIFVGTLAYWPNVEGVLMFAKKAMPLLLERFPALEFWIVGRGPIEEVLALDNGGNIRVFGDVPDVVEYVRQCSVSIVPLRVGGGTRLKILESIGAGVPVITTTVGVEGIALQPEKHYLLAHGPQEFSAGVTRLLEEPALGRAQVESARKVIAERYTWRAIREDLARRLRGFMGTASAP
jgi:glycosyltransferase involved in cell wall biosynthesis